MEHEIRYVVHRSVTVSVLNVNVIRLYVRFRCTCVGVLEFCHNARLNVCRERFSVEVKYNLSRSSRNEDSIAYRYVVVELDNGGLRADITARIVYLDGERIEMSPKEYDLFFYLLSNRNIALSREKLLCEVWGYDFYGDARTLDTHIKLLRKSLGKYSKHIVTLRGVGYRFEAI